METLQILFIVVPVIALIAAIKFLFFGKEDREYTITVNIESEDILHPKMSSGANVQVPSNVVADSSEPVAKPKRRYKKRKKKAVVAQAPVAEVVPAVKKKVGRPRKTN